MIFPLYLREKRMRINSIIRKIPFHKKLLFFINLDIVDQIKILLRFFVPILVIGGFIQYFWPHILGHIDIVSGTICTFIVLVFLLSLPEDKIEVISPQKQCLRFLTMFINLGIGVFYMLIIACVATKLLIFVENCFTMSDEMTFCFRCLWYLIVILMFVWLVIFKFNKKLFFKLHYGEIKDVHILNIEKETFLQIVMQKKNFEFRLADIKRRRIKVGDILVFNNIDNPLEFVTTEITALYFADNFCELLSKLSDNDELKNQLISLNEQYSLARQKKRKVIAIKFVLPS